MISPNVQHQLEKDYENLIHILKEEKYSWQSIPSDLFATNSKGSAFAIAYPIQGLLKYHGMVDKFNKIAFFPSISVNNDSGVTISFLHLDSQLQSDQFILNEEKLLSSSSKYQRIKAMLDVLRELTGINRRCLLVSKNIDPTTNQILTGKGLGTSASAGAALATAFMEIVYKDQPNLRKNIQLKSYFSRFLAGSATRSAVGGIGLWLSHPTISSEDCYALRLDRSKDQKFIQEIKLITIPIPSTVTTNQIHDYAPKSPFFEAWLKERRNMLEKFLRYFWNHNFEKLGELIEHDTLALHGVSLTGKVQSPDILWEPDTIKIMKLVQNLRTNGISAYFSIDTGPSVVILALKRETSKIIQNLQKLRLEYPILEGAIGDASQIVSSNHPLAKLLTKEIKSYDVIPFEN